jgi:hypothetical protein
MKTTAIPVSPLQSPSGSRLAARLPDFVTFMKPRVMALAVFTALLGMITAPGHLDPLVGSTAVLGIAAGASAAGVLNMWCEALSHQLDRGGAMFGRPAEPQAAVAAPTSETPFWEDVKRAAGGERRWTLNVLWTAA